ncbi:MAG TPA: class I SAM-dependent methyltransferase [Methylococcus sp.]|nr:class I SAM-dependent methyltransferase [Methylococcus sp.]
MQPEAYRTMAETEAHHWWFAGRRDLLTAEIARLPLPNLARILEVGCGTGGNLEMLAAFGQVHAFDPDHEALALAREKTRTKCELRSGRCPSNLPFEGDFDLICLFDVLEHIAEDVATLDALRPRLRDSGRILITVPAHPRLWSRHDELLLHCRRYTARELRKKIRDTGYRLERLTYFNTFLSPLVLGVRLADRLTGKSEPTGLSTPPDPVNSVLYRVFRAERLWLRQARLPFGISLLACATRR